MITNKLGMEKDAFIIYGDYEYNDTAQEAKIRIIARAKTGDLINIIFRYEPYFYIKKKDYDTISKQGIDKDFEEMIKEVKNTNLKTMDTGEEVVKIILYNPKDVPKLRNYLEEKEINTYEADIRFVQRFLIDHELTTTIKLSFNKEEQEKRDKHGLHIESPSIRASQEKFSMEDLRVISMDIETDPDESRILAISLYSPRKSYTIICYPGMSENERENLKQGIVKDLKSNKDLREMRLGIPEIYIEPNETALLERFVSIIREEDPDVITGWNFLDFDLAFLREKSKALGIKLGIGRDGSDIELRITKSYLRRSTAKCFGRQILDGISLMRDAYIPLEDYKLETAAQLFIGKGKLIKGMDRGPTIYDYYKNDPSKLVAYNLVDAFLAFMVVKNSNALNIALEKSSITGLTLDRVGGSISAFDALYLSNLRKRGLVARSVDYEEKEESILGGYVKEPIPGLYENALVLDFKSLYPSIMKTFNIDPLTFTSCSNNKEDLIRAPNNVCFKLKPEGIISELLTVLWQRRQEAKRNNEVARSHALKILMNSMFGAMANPVCRYYNLGIANAITAFGRLIVQKTASFIEEKGYKVIYSDTDSVFVDTGLKEYEKAGQLGKKLEEEINSYYKEWVKKEYQRESYLEIEFEKVYVKLMFFKTRSGISGEGAKKKYAGLVRINGKEELDLVGVEAVRRDWTMLARNFQRELLLRVFRNEPVEEFINNFISRLKKGELDDLLVYKKALRKPLSEYIKTTPPHVKAAKLLGKELKSNIIEYVITISGPEPVGKIKHKIDYDHYINKQIKPIADSILQILGKSMDKALRKDASLLRFTGRD